MKSAKHKIVIVGCGNVAWHLAKHLNSLKKYSINVYNHAENNELSDFKSKLKCTVEVGFQNIISDADFYFVCVSDKHVSTVSKKISTKNANALVMHCSGSLPIEALKGSMKHKAVFYPLQSFSKSISISWKETPILIDANSAFAKLKVGALSKHFSSKIIEVQYKTRLKLHLAAVLVNNFTNSLYVAADDLISGNEGNTNFEVLLPLIKQGTQKIEKISPRLAQTGPAKRHDMSVMKKHARLLSDQPELKKIYKQLSKLIVKQQKG